MQLPLNVITLVMLSAFLVFPYSYLNESVVIAAIMLLHSISIFICAKRYLNTGAQSARLFWQFFTLSLAISLVSAATQNLGLFDHSNLLPEFFSLFCYFFAFLAIETNPHLSEVPLNRYINGRVPSIFFVVFTFCYFVLLPFEFTIEQYHQEKSLALFHIIVSSAICLRITSFLLSKHTDNWHSIYWILAIAAFSLTLSKVDLFMHVIGRNGLPEKLSIAFAFIPYFLVIIAALKPSEFQSQKIKKQPKNIELYVFTLLIITTTIHLIGIELKLFYILNNVWQSVLILSWIFVSLLFILFTNTKKNRYFYDLKHICEQQETNITALNEQNINLHTSLIKSEEKAIVYVSNNAIFTTSIEGKVRSANPAAIQMFQCLEQDILGHSISKLLSTDDKMHHFFKFKSNIFTLQRKESGISIECLAIRSNDETFPVQAELQWAEREEEPLIVITFINLTARKLAEKQALDLKDKFIANISHEFRTPLTIMNGILERHLNKTSVQQELKELTTAKRNGLRLVRMVEQLLELSRLSDNPSLNLATYRLTTLLSMPADSFQKLAEQNGIQFEASLQDNIWITCDPQGFEKIIFNLLTNAIKYTPKGGKVSVIAHQELDNVVIDIIDTGIGINKESQSKIFERFQRASDTKNHSIFGVGIGLSLVNELIKAHHWRLNLISEYNQGSKFSIVIPKAKPQQIEQKLPISTSEQDLSSLLIERSPTEAQNGANLQHVVLIIEDNLEMQSHIKQVLELHHHCLLALSGEVGVDIAQEYLPDLIVCDIMLSGIDGFEVLKRIKTSEITAHIPIVMLTARSDLESKIEGLNSHADDYLSKPFNPNELLVRITNLIEGRKKLQLSYKQHFQKQEKETRKINSLNNANELTDQDSVTMNELFLTKLENLLAQKFTEPSLDISHIAKELAVSERQLQRKIKTLLDTTPNNIIKEFRLKKAETLLSNGSQIGRVALDVGFSSQTYFGRCFKEKYGCTPKQYQHTQFNKKE